MIERLRRLGRIVRQPVLAETRGLLAGGWGSLPPRFRVLQQMYGRQGNACGATIGAMPRCDFACRGCYLGEAANHIPPEPIEAIKAQMRALRPVLGNNGNLQLTDGEITLRPEAELIVLLRYADQLGLIPMLMTHGDSFRRRPGLLERLMVEGGLREVSIHVDTTMRGRAGGAYKHATREQDLNPLREEFADLIRSARKRTGQPLVAATTMTITRDNLDGVPAALRCVMGLADAFKMISFQPAAQVGRTEDGLGGGVGAEELWQRIAMGLEGPVRDAGYLTRCQMWLGHPGCNRTVHGYVVRQKGGPLVYAPLRLQGDPVDERAIDRYLARFGGASFRRDTRLEGRVRLASMIARAPRLWLSDVAPFLAHLVGRMDPERPLRLAWRLLAGKARADHFQIVSHHFMSQAEIETALGQERLGMCVFKVPIGERLLSMCEVNALGVRDRYYEDIRAADGSGRELRIL